MKMKKVIAGVLALILAVAMVPASVTMAAKASVGHGFNVNGKNISSFDSLILKKGETLNWTDESTVTSVSSSCSCKNNKRFIYTNYYGFSLSGDTSHVKTTSENYNIIKNYSNGKAVYDKSSALTSVTAKDGPVKITPVNVSSSKYLKQIEFRCWGPNDKGILYGNQCETHYNNVGIPYKVEYLGGNSIKAELNLDGGIYTDGSEAKSATIDLGNIDKSISSIKMPVKAGYTFAGWIIESDEYGSFILALCENNKYSKSIFEINNYTWNLAKNIVKNGAKIKALWDRAEIEYTLDANGGIFEYDKTDIIKAGIIIGEVPVKEGYYFDGWYIGDVRIQDYTDIPTDKWNKEQKYTLKAKWSAAPVQPEEDDDQNVETPSDDGDITLPELPSGEVHIVDFWLDGSDSEVVYSEDEGVVSKGIEGISYDPSKNKLEITNLPEGSNISVDGANIDISVSGTNDAKLTIRGESNTAGTVTFSGNGTLNSSQIQIDGKGGNTQVVFGTDVTINVSDGGFVVEDTINPNPVVISAGSGISSNELKVTAEFRPEYNDGRIVVSKDGKQYCAAKYKTYGKIEIFELGSWEPLEGRTIKWDGKASVTKTLEKAGYTIKRTEKKIYSASVSDSSFTISSKYASSEATNEAKKLILGVKALSKKTKAEVVFINEPGASNYEIRYATSAKMTGAKTKKASVKKNTMTGSVKLAKLKAKKTYYIQVRKITTDDNGKKVAGDWSATWKYKVK